jgi:hypothetical protein
MSSIVQSVLSFAAAHSALITQIEGMALNELISLIKQMSSDHPLFAEVAMAIVNLVEKSQGIQPQS